MLHYLIEPRKIGKFSVSSPLLIMILVTLFNANSNTSIGVAQNEY